MRTPIAAALLLSATVHATPAHATVPPVVACGYAQYCTGTYVATTNSIVFTCTAVTPYVVATTSVGCYLGGRVSGTRYYATSTNIPGQTATTYVQRGAYYDEPYELCVAAAYNSLTTTNTGCLTFPL